MHNELNKIKNKPKYSKINCEKMATMDQSEMWMRSFRERDNSIITDIFEG
jgi:hypothetical protein